MPSRRSKPNKRKRQTRRREPKRSGSLLRYFRGFLGILGILGILCLVGSVFMHGMVIKRIQVRAASSSTLVLTRAFPVIEGTHFFQAKIQQRLARLGYREVNEEPQRPGLYQLKDNEVLLFLQEARMPDSTIRPAELVRLTLKDEKVAGIHNVKFNQQLGNILLEPEALSTLGHSSTRASTPYRLNEFPELTIKAVLAMEDVRFYSHFGLDLKGILRAIYINIKEGRVVQGASTITQQLAKNLFLTPERSLKRKLIEAFSALLIELSYNKDQILEFYLNEIFLGQEGNVAIHGFGEAAHSFFRKSVTEISLSEMATLAGIIKAPSTYSPRRHPKRALKRRNVVLKKMLELGYISEKDHYVAHKEKLEIKPALRSKRVSPYFVDFIGRSITPILDARSLSTDPYMIHTGLDREYQLCAEEAVKKGIARIEEASPRLKSKKSPLQSALVAVTPHTGEVRAWVGGRDYQENQFDRVSQAKRQPGSAFKPFVYLTALDKDLNTYRVARTTSTLPDEPMKIHIPGAGIWEPKNYDKKFRGEVTVRQALTYSLNVPTVYLAQKIGVDAIAGTAQLLGFGANLPRVPSLALGAGEVTPLELARAYTAVANNGLLINLRPVVTVTVEKEDEPVYESYISETRAASAQAAFVLTDMMQSVIQHGTGKNVRRFGYEGPAAGKTGTTNGPRDAWFAGFTPQLLTVVWVGRDDNGKTGLTGGSAAAPIWAEFMKCVAPMEQVLDFVAPPGVVYRKVDFRSGLLATDSCPASDVVTEIFVAGNEPVTPCQLHKSRPGRQRRFEDDAARKIPRGRRRSNWDRFWDDVFGP